MGITYDSRALQGRGQALVDGRIDPKFGFSASEVRLNGTQTIIQY